MTDIEINRKAKKENILKIAKKLDIEKKYLECYGTDKAKIDLKILNKLNDKTNGKLISSIGTTWEYPPPVAPPLIPNTGPKDGSLKTAKLL